MRTIKGKKIMPTMKKISSRVRARWHLNISNNNRNRMMEERMKSKSGRIKRTIKTKKEVKMSWLKTKREKTRMKKRKHLLLIRQRKSKKEVKMRKSSMR